MQSLPLKHQVERYRKNTLVTMAISSTVEFALGWERSFVAMAAHKFFIQRAFLTA
jgi:hypothetical protein